MKNVFEELDKSNVENFTRSTGIRPCDFDELMGKIKDYSEKQRELHPIHKRGQKSSLDINNRLLLSLLYLRDYPTFLKLGCSFGISESYANKIFHQMLDIMVKVQHVPSAKDLMRDDLEAIAIDVTENPIERPVHGQKEFYSGKKKRHTVKAQLIICLVTLCILSVVCKKGHVHDFKILKESKLSINEKTIKYVDLGYLGIDKIMKNSKIPHKKSKNKKLTKEEKKENRELAKMRIKIEHVNRRCKIFKIVKETYRGKHKNYGKVWNVIAGLVNLRYSNVA